MRKLAGFLAIIAAGFASAQSPDVAIFADLRPTWSFEDNSRSRFQWHDLQARYSLVGFRLILEPGLRVNVAQRIDRIKHSGDPDSLDEYYIEDRGTWRVGKQYLPFGTRNMLRETALAARYDTSLILEDIPLSIAYAYAGTDRIRGVVGRIGRSAGISFAVGNHFGIQATALTQIQLPHEAAGVGRGYRFAFGADATWDVKEFVVVAEWVMLRDGETALDESRDITDLKVIYPIPRSTGRLIGAWSRSWDRNENFFRIEGELPFDEKISWVPILRFDSHRLRDFGLSARLRF